MKTSRDAPMQAPCGIDPVRRESRTDSSRGCVPARGQGADSSVSSGTITKEHRMDTSENAELGHEVPTLGNPDLPQEGEVNIADRPQSNTMGGPQNEVIESQFPNHM